VVTYYWLDRLKIDHSDGVVTRDELQKLGDDLPIYYNLQHPRTCPMGGAYPWDVEEILEVMYD